MPSQVYEQQISLTLPMVEPVAIDPQNVPECYPWVPLKCSDNKTTSLVPVIVLENSFLRLKVLPNLGGRIYELHDKRTGTDIIPISPEPTVVADSYRGVQMQSGIEIHFGGHHRGNHLGRVEYQLREPGHDEEPAAIFLHELDSGSGVSWTSCITLHPNEAQITLEVRLTNRTLHQLNLRTGLKAWLHEDHQPTPNSPFCWHSPATKSGFQIHCAEPIFTAELQANRLAIESLNGTLGPRRTHESKFIIIPYSGLDQLTASTHRAALSLGDEIKIQVPAKINQAKLILQTADGQSFEAQTELQPHETWVGNVSNLPAPVSRLLLRDFDKNEILAYDSQTQSVHPSEPIELGVNSLSSMATDQLLAAFNQDPNSPAAFYRFTQSPGMESLGYLGLTILKIKEEDWAGANSLIDKSLITQSEDAILWWLKAAILRNMGEAHEDRPELLNSHYLDPLEPLLRAEAFLSQPVSEFKEPNPITKPLAENPEEAIEVACTLLECGFLQDFAKFCDEILRHEEIPGIRDLYAYALLTHSRLKATAAEQLAIAATIPLKPPFPWRPVQKRALNRLSQEFPKDSRLKTLLRLIGE